MSCRHVMVGQDREGQGCVRSLYEGCEKCIDRQS